MRYTFVRDPGGWDFARKDSEAGPVGGVGYSDPGTGI
ncbi:Uncharacterised protein [Bacillus cereus]|nr:Uncharacterised protein [Bacillus cereus]